MVGVSTVGRNTNKGPILLDPGNFRLFDSERSRVLSVLWSSKDEAPEGTMSNRHASILFLTSAKAPSYYPTPWTRPCPVLLHGMAVCQPVLSRRLAV